MQVRARLCSLLEDYLPLEIPGDTLDLELSPGAAVTDLLARLGVDEDRVHLVILNGRFVARHARGSTLLSDGDDVELWPLVAGG